jgi:hypothetical protein
VRLPPIPIIGQRLDLGAGEPDPVWRRGRVKPAAAAIEDDASISILNAPIRFSSANAFRRVFNGTQRPADPL